MSDTAAPVLHDKRGHAFWITINRPDKRNAINADVIAGIRAGYRAAQADADVRVIVLTGAGDKAFCAGADLQPGKGFAFDATRPNLDYADLMRDAHNATLPSIARVNGVCMAGGMGLLCMTDMAVAADHVLFGLPEVKVGVFPMQVMSLLQQIAPRRLVREWALSGEPFDAAQALQAGLLNHVAPANALDAKVDWLVGTHRRQIAHRDPARQIRDARDRGDVVRPGDRLHREPDRAAGDDRRRQGGAGVVQRKAQAAVARALTRRPIGQAITAVSCGRRQSRAASDAGTATGMSSRICAMPLPSGSNRADAGPPPASASCSMKFIASMPGSRKRSTRPFTRCEKCRCTASGVTRCHSNGSHSGRRAMTPMLEMLPLSPLRP